MFSKFSLKTKIIWIILILLFGVYMIRGQLVRTHDSYIGGGTDSSQEQAIQEVSNIVTNKLQKCGDYYYCKTIPARGMIQFTQFKDMELNVESYPISEVDKLNRVEWNGAVIYNFKFERTRTLMYYETKNMWDFQSWSDWRTANKYGYRVSKVRGQWHIYKGWGISNLYFTDDLTCSEIPQ